MALRVAIVLYSTLGCTKIKGFTALFQCGTVQNNVTSFTLSQHEHEHQAANVNRSNAGDELNSQNPGPMWPDRF